MEVVVKINKIYPYNMRNDTHFQFFTEFRGQVIKSGAENLGIGQQFTAWLPLYEKEDTALKKIVKSAITAQLHKADKERDDMYTGMVETNTTALKHFNANVRDAATRLKILFDTYGNVTKLPLNDETSSIYNILQELEGKYTADAVTVGISGWAAELKTRNNTFSELMTQRFDETAHQTDIVLKDARAEVDAAYFEMRERINALAVVNGLTAYEEFIRTMNAIIAKYNSRAGRHRHKHGNEMEDEEAPDDVTEPPENLTEPPEEAGN